MTRRFLYFINPISGTRNKSSLQKSIQNQTAAYHIPFEIVDTSKEGDYAFLPEKIKQDKITDVIICGGDGTVNQIVSFLIGVQVNVGIIPMGSGNGLALAAGIPKNHEQALKIILDGRAKAVDGVRINNHFSCMLSGLGFDAQVAHQFAEQRKRGLLTYIRLSLLNYFKAVSYPFELVIDNRVIPVDALFISVANSNQFGNHVIIAPKAKLNDGKMDVVVVTNQNRLSTAITILRQIMRGKVTPTDQVGQQQKKVLYFQTDRLVIKNLGSAPFHVDGEPITTEKEFNFSIIPKAFQLLQS